MYRQTDDRKVWYEWMAEVFAVERPAEPSRAISSPVMSGGRADSGGENGEAVKEAQKAEGSFCPRRIKVGMSDLHSSIKEGCQM